MFDDRVLLCWDFLPIYPGTMHRPTVTNVDELNKVQPILA